MKRWRSRLLRAFEWWGHFNDLRALGFEVWRIYWLLLSGTVFVVGFSGTIVSLLLGTLGWLSSEWATALFAVSVLSLLGGTYLSRNAFEGLSKGFVQRLDYFSSEMESFIDIRMNVLAVFEKNVLTMQETLEARLADQIGEDEFRDSVNTGLRLMGDALRVFVEESEAQQARLRGALLLDSRVPAVGSSTA